MRTTRRTKAAAAVLAAGVVAGGAALLVPGAASAADAGATPSSTASPSASATDRATDRAAERVAAIKDALKGLVSDGTIDQAQADRVASTLAATGADRDGHGWDGHDGWNGHGWHGDAGRIGPDQVASILGITTDQLRTAQRSGQTLTQIAQAHGISRSDLVAKLVAAARTQLAEDVEAGRTTQAQSDEISSDLSTRIGDAVDRVRPDHGPSGDHGGRDDDGDADDAPSGSASPSPSTTS